MNNHICGASLAGIGYREEQMMQNLLALKSSENALI
jgi:hypothetical protein